MKEPVADMFTVTHTHQDATWRTDARRDVTGHGSTSVRTERSATEPFINKVNFPAIAPTRRGAPPL